MRISSTSNGWATWPGTSPRSLGCGTPTARCRRRSRRTSSRWARSRADRRQGRFGHRLHGLHRGAQPGAGRRRDGAHHHRRWCRHPLGARGGRRAQQDELARPRAPVRAACRHPARRAGRAAARAVRAQGRALPRHRARRRTGAAAVDRVQLLPGLEGDRDPHRWRRDPRGPQCRRRAGGSSWCAGTPRGSRSGADVPRSGTDLLDLWPGERKIVI